MFQVIFLIILTNSLFPPIQGQCFNQVSFTVFRDYRKIILQLADTVNDEKYTTEIIAEHQNIPVLETGCFKKLPKLKYITVTRCGVTDMEMGTFMELPQLRAISMTFNNIKVIRNAVFHSLELVKLSLAANHIEEIEQHAFYNLTSLEVINLSLNDLTSLKSDIFFKTTNLRQINLSNNRLLFVFDSFFSDCFAPVESYKSLINLSFNNISVIERNTFKGVYFINSLLLNDNNIKKIDPNAFYDLKQGKTLDLRDNALKNVPTKIIFGKFKEILYDDDDDEDLIKEELGNINNLHLAIPSGNFTLQAENTTTLVLTQE